MDLWRNPGDDLEIATSEYHARPTQTKALTCIFGNVHRSAAFQGLIRDEEAAGSTPTTKRRVIGGRRAHVASRPIGAMGREG
jgi:hypothetical protein